MARAVLCVVLALFGLVQGRHEQYEGHKLYRLSAPAEKITALDEQVDLWGISRAKTTGELETVLKLAPVEEQKWLQVFGEKGIQYELINDNVANLFRDEDMKLEQSRASVTRALPANVTWDTYYRHDEINDYLDSLAEQYPEYVTLINAGLSYEGRQIKYVRISSSRFESLTKPVIVLDAAIHAREWVTTPVALYIIHQLVVELAETELLEQADWVVIPVANPDGYEYTFTDDRLWRKTRSKTHPGWDANPTCVGIDGNRNYDHYFGTSASTADPCTILYEGPTAFSESETRVVRAVIMQYLSRVKLYISLHSYGNMFLYAWGNNGTLPDNGLFLHLAGIQMATAIEKLALPKADRYVVGNAAQVLYFSTGTSRDWVRSVGVPLTYTLELPGYEYFFVVPPEYIRQIVTETWAGIVAGARFVIGNY